MRRSVKVGRRPLLAGSGALGVFGLTGCPNPSPLPVTRGRFRFGVASGDPTTTSVILWSHLEVTRPEEVEVRVYRDPAETELVGSDYAIADPMRDGCIKVDFEGLVPGTTYYFRFVRGREVSVLGRTRTLPEGRLESLRLAVLSCTNFAYGWFHGYREIARRPDLDAIVHLGDSIYEYADGVYGDARELEPRHEIVSLADYRRRTRQTRGDADLQDALRQHPFLIVWDDHELANNAYRDGAENHTEALEGPWRARHDAARRAFFEWNPVRDETRVDRSLVFGDLARLLMLDTRDDGREGWPAGDAERLAADRRMMSAAQEERVRLALGERDVVHTLLANQVIFAPVPFLANFDAWDGYPAQRDRILRGLEAAPSHPVVLTGDTHSAHAFDVPTSGYDAVAQRGAAAVEWTVPALASRELSADPAQHAADLLGSTSHLRWTDQRNKGYLLLDLDRARARGEWYFTADPRDPLGRGERLAKVFESSPSRRACAEVEPVAFTRAGSPPLAPRDGV